VATVAAIGSESKQNETPSVVDVAFILCELSNTVGCVLIDRETGVFDQSQTVLDISSCDTTNVKSNKCTWYSTVLDNVKDDMESMAAAEVLVSSDGCKIYCSNRDIKVYNTQDKIDKFDCSVAVFDVVAAFGTSRGVSLKRVQNITSFGRHTRAMTLMNVQKYQSFNDQSNKKRPFDGNSDRKHTILAIANKDEGYEKLSDGTGNFVFFLVDDENDSGSESTKGNLNNKWRYIVQGPADMIGCKIDQPTWIHVLEIAGL
jgi:hypothetical protein